MEVLLGLVVAASIGAADFFGGMAGRRTGPLRTITGVQFSGAAVVGIYLLATWQPLGGARENALAAIAGAVLSIGVMCMYAGLSWGRMSVIAPVTAAVVALGTFAIGLVRGERPSALALGGVGLAILAVILISRPPGAADAPDPMKGAARRLGLGGELALSIAAGGGFATFQTLLLEIGTEAGLAPLLVLRGVGGVVGLIALGVIGVRSGSVGLQMPRRDRVVLVCVAGTLLLVAHAFLLEALDRGFLSIVGPITSLSPAFTVIPARIFLHEHISRTQVVGMVLATIGLVLVALG